MADEALACFQAILDTVPVWIADLENILKDAAKRQNDRLFAEQPTESPTLRKSSKASSLRSNRNSGRHAPLNSSESQPSQLVTQLPHLTNSDVLRLSQRKRKTASVCSDDESNPSKYRSRTMVVVYYDGDTQKSIEDLVRVVGTHRNAIRKGKISTKMENFKRSGSGSSQSSDSSSKEDYVKGLGTIAYRTTTNRGNDVFGGSEDGTEVFDTVDGFLEKAQAICERAAHQILRDGDCSPEMDKARDYFSTAMHTINTELPSLRARAKKASERRRISEERRHADNDIRNEKQHIITSIKVDPIDRQSLPSDSALEVDDTDDLADDSDSGELDLTTMKLPPQLGRYQMGRGRDHGGGLAAVH